MYDLGIPRREDLSTLPGFEAFTKALSSDEDEPCLVRQHTFPGDGCVEDSLTKGGVQPGEVDVVIISHLHWDHIGDARPFTKAEFILGAEGKGIIIGEDPQARKPVVIPISAPAERTHFITNWETSIGGLRAHNFFGDGSMYVLDTPGHLPGHVAVLARTSPDGSWILLVGDAVHHRSILNGERDFASHDDGHGGIMCVHVDPELTRDTMRKLKALEDMPKVQLLLAHEDIDKDVFLPGRFVPLA